MGDEIQLGDVFEPKDGPPSQAVEVVGLKAGGLVDLRKIDTGVTFDACADLLLDPLRWTRAGYMGTRTPPIPPQRAPDHVVPPLTVGMERKLAKWRPSLVPSGTVEAIARAMQAGIDRGHVEGDWSRREPIVYLDATLRHLYHVDQDHHALDESGLLAVDHALAALAILRHQIANERVTSADLPGKLTP